MNLFFFYQAGNIAEFLMWDIFTNGTVVAEDGVEIWLMLMDISALVLSRNAHQLIIAQDKSPSLLRSVSGERATFPRGSLEQELSTAALVCALKGHMVESCQPLIICIT